uniref:Uncharacterized protein n=1 Tax=Hyaloperonospora arabidopsidis (strain Emoy2) TaxID=559515 RepID=M4BNT5_HYAAE
MSDEVLLGYTAAVVAVFFFGTCYVPAKTYATYGTRWCYSVQDSLFPLSLSFKSVFSV